MTSLILFTFLSLGTVALASYCGQSAIPYSFKAEANGQPVLGCARPTCFGWNADGRRAADSAQFYKIDNKWDGSLRITDFKGPVISNATSFRPQFAICDRTYMWDQCIGANQWIGGISPLAKITPDSAYRVMCCTYPKLSEAIDSGVAEIKPDESVVGGEIHGEDQRQIAFEYISNIRRSFNDKGEVVYHVTLKRFPCLPEAVAPPAKVEDGTTEVLIRNVEKERKEAVQFGAQTFQASGPQPAPTFNNMKFDIPNNTPAEEAPKQPLHPLQLATAAPANTEAASPPAAPKFVNGRLIPSAKPYPDDQGQSAPIAIPQVQQGVVPAAKAQPQAPAYYPQPQSQPQQQPSFFQTSLLDPFGLFRQAYHAVPTATVGAPVQHPTLAPMLIHNSPLQAIPQPNLSYNPYWPLQGYYDYSRNPAATYGVQTAQASPSGAPQPLIPHPPAKLPLPRPKPIPMPSIEDVEKAIPPAGQRMIANVARTLLNL